MTKNIIEYDIPVQDEEQVEEHNKMCREMFGEQFTPLKSTEAHMDILFEKLEDAINKVGDEGGWYVGDGIKVKVEIEYDPENK